MSEILSETLAATEEQRDENQENQQDQARQESRGESQSPASDDGNPRGERSSDAAETVVLVDITEAAARKAAEVLAGSSSQGIRIAVTGGGCAGLQYDLKPEAGPAEADIVIEAFGVPFYLHPMVLPYIKGTRIDYVSSLMEGGFKFINPNAANTCGCGTSFGI